jgi:hypothetical protein
MPNFIDTIDENECIGDSLNTLNENFISLDTEIYNLKSSTISTSDTNTISHTFIPQARLLSSNVRDNSVNAQHLANNAVITSKIAPDTVRYSQLASIQTLSASPTLSAEAVQPRIAKAWACFSYSSTTGLTAQSSFNISSISPLGSSKFIVYFITPMSDRNYVVHVNNASQIAASLMHVQNGASNDMTSIPSVRTPDATSSDQPYKGTDGIKIGGDGTSNWSEIYISVYGN